jgi:hypothetical protein
MFCFSISGKNFLKFLSSFFSRQKRVQSIGAASRARTRTHTATELQGVCAIGAIALIALV